jgi:hypothetical protein
MEQYVMIDSTRHCVRRYRWDGEGRFVADLDQISGPVFITSIGYALDIDAMYLAARV